MTFRFARHTSKLRELTDFYVSILGLEILGDFKNHAGYDGVFIGKSSCNWHLEFTQTLVPASHTFDEDDLLVFYPASQAEHTDLLNRIDAHKIKKVSAKNPYWRANGLSILDPDGYSIVISPLKIST